MIVHCVGISIGICHGRVRSRGACLGTDGEVRTRVVVDTDTDCDPADMHEAAFSGSRESGSVPAEGRVR